MDDSRRLDEGGLGCMTHVRALRLARFPCAPIYRAMDSEFRLLRMTNNWAAALGHPFFRHLLHF